MPDTCHTHAEETSAYPIQCYRYRELKEPDKHVRDQGGDGGQGLYFITDGVRGPARVVRSGEGGHPHLLWLRSVLLVGSHPPPFLDAVAILMAAALFLHFLPAVCASFY